MDSATVQENLRVAPRHDRGVLTMKIAKFHLRPASSPHLRRPANDETDRDSLCKRGNRRIPDLPHREIATPAAQPSASPLRPIARPTACPACPAWLQEKRPAAVPPRLGSNPCDSRHCGPARHLLEKHRNAPICSLSYPHLILEIRPRTRRVVGRRVVGRAFRPQSPARPKVRRGPRRGAVSVAGGRTRSLLPADPDHYVNSL